MPRPAIFTSEVLGQIPNLVAHGLSKAQIAEMLGCKASSLQVRCSTAGISLRRGARKKVDQRKLRLSADAVGALKLQATARGRCEFDLASELLEVIARDDLFSAVLDEPVLQPQAQFTS